MSETVQQIKAGDALIGGPRLALIAGPCLVEDEESTYSMASRLSETCHALDVPFIFKASYDKANRTAVTSARGPGWQKGLQIVARVGRRAGVPVLSDVHEVGQIGVAAEVLDMLQIPAFLCRQTDLLVAAGETGRPINIKKGQFMAPDDMEHSVAKVTSTGNRNVSVTERGSSFGYHNLVVDMRGLQIMRGFGYPVIFDATHSVQLPGGAGGASGGQRDLAPALARAAVAVGIDALFIEVHPDPDNAPCDGPNMLPIDEVGPLLTTLIAIREAVRETAQGG